MPTERPNLNPDPSNPSPSGRGRGAAVLAVLLTLGLIASACVTVASEDGDERRLAVLSTESDASAVAPSEVPMTVAAPEPQVVEPVAPMEGAGDIAGVAEMSEPDPQESSAQALASRGAIGYISLDESQAFVRTISGGIREAVAEAGLDLVECDSGWTRPGVLACAAEMAAAGVSGVISMQPFPDLDEAVCQALGGLPTIGIVYDQGPCQVSLLEIDQAESGRLAGSALGTLAARRFACEVKAYVSLESGAQDEIGGARMDGYREGYQEHCPLPDKTFQLNDAQHLVTARSRFAGVLDKVKGKPIIVAGVSEDAILGAMGAATNRGRANHVWVGGQLADPVIRQTIACDERYVASVAQFPERFGSAVVPTLLAAIDGADVPPRLLADLELVTAENVRRLFPDTPACDG